MSAGARSGSLAWRLGVGTMLGLALFWYGVRPWFGDRPVPGLAVPACLLAGMAVPPPRHWLAARPCGRLPAWAGALAVLAFVLLVGLVAWGALATPSRHWDGVVAWDVRAQALAARATLAQPLFADPAVYCHSRDYPLLQPFAVAGLEQSFGAGRAFFPLLFAALAALVFAGARRDGAPRWLPCALALACAATPALVNPTSGAADSGLAELLFACCVATAALGWVHDLPIVVALGVLCGIASKPEGLALAGIVVVLALARGTRAHVHAAVGAAALGVLVWLPVHASLRPGSPPPSWEYAVVVVVAGVVLAADAVLRARASGRRRAALALAGVGAVTFAVALLPVEWAAADTSMGRYFGARAAFVQRLAALPAIGASFVEYAVLRASFGATFVLPLLAWIGLRRARVAVPEGARAAAAFLVLGGGLIVLPFLLSPELDLGHHLRSSMARLQLHWLGAAWIVSGALLHALLARRTEAAA